eukprot:g817.t1
MSSSEDMEKRTLTFRIGNRSEALPSNKSGREFYRVTLFVAGDVKEILRVRFGFHQTLSKPEAVVKNAPFEIGLKLWGYFDVPVTIELKNSDEQIVYEHEIELEDGGSYVTKTYEVLLKKKKTEAEMMIENVRLGNHNNVEKYLNNLSEDIKKSNEHKLFLHQAICISLVEHRIKILTLLLSTKQLSYFGHSSKNNSNDITSSAAKQVQSSTIHHSTSQTQKTKIAAGVAAQKMIKKRVKKRSFNMKNKISNRVSPMMENRISAETTGSKSIGSVSNETKKKELNGKLSPEAELWLRIGNGIRQMRRERSLEVRNEVDEIVAKGIYSLLEKKKVDLFCRDRFGRQVQHQAASEGLVKTLAVLSARGGISDDKDRDGLNIFHHAVRNASFFSLKWLLQLCPWKTIKSKLHKLHGEPLQGSSLLRFLLQEAAIHTAYGPNLTPLLLAKAVYDQSVDADESFYVSPEYAKRSFALLTKYDVPWSSIENCLSGGNEINFDEKLSQLFDLDAEGEANLSLFHKVVKTIAEGVGVIEWHNERIELIISNLLTPLISSIGSKRLNPKFKDLAKRLLIQSRYFDTTIDGKAFQVIVKQLILNAETAMSSTLNELQNQMKTLPNHTEKMKMYFENPISWKDPTKSLNSQAVPHLVECHAPLQFLSNDPKNSTLVDVYIELKKYDIVTTAEEFSRWVDYYALPTIQWALSNDESIREGTSGPASCSRSVLSVMASAIKLVAYDSILLALAREADSQFQQCFSEWFESRKHPDVGGVRKGPVKLIDRVREKKYDYMNVDEKYVNLPKASPEFITKVAAPPVNHIASGRIMDYSRATVCCASEEAMVHTLDLLLNATLEKDNFMPILCKNGHHHEAPVRNSGYRDCKVLLLYQLREKDSDTTAIAEEKKHFFVHELQILHSLQLECKKFNHMLYAMIR